MTFNTSRLAVQPISEFDKRLYCTIYTSDVLLQYVKPALSMIEAEKSWAIAMRHRHKFPPKMRYWSIYEKDSKTQIGIGGLIWDKLNPSRANIGCMFLANAQSQGYGTEFTQAMTPFAFKTFSLSELYCHSMLENKRAFNILSQRGYSYRCVLTQQQFEKPGYYWSLLKSDWLKIEKKHKNQVNELRLNQF